MKIIKPAFTQLFQVAICPFCIHPTALPPVPTLHLPPIAQTMLHSLQTRSMRAQGSCALDMCAAACGRVDFTYEIGFGGCWDCAAGALIVEEAGGEVLDPAGGPFNLMSRRVLAGNKSVTRKAADVIAKQPLGPQEPPSLPH